MFGSLMTDPRLGRPKARRRIAIVTPDITGPILNGGVGTAYRHLAQSLADAGHDVTVLFVNEITRSPLKFHLWQEYYLKRGIRLLSLPEAPVPLEGQWCQRAAYGVYLALKDGNFDLVHFPDMGGLGFYSLLAKRRGLAFAQTELITILHGPGIWHREQNFQPMFSPTDIQQTYLERRSIEDADTLVAPTEYALQWARSRGWKLPQRTFVEQNIFQQDPKDLYRGPRVDAREIVFFGRLESRKGLDIFCDAIELLPKGLLEGRRVTFMGITGNVMGRPALPYLRARLKKWKCDVNLILDHGQPEALRYLRSGATLAVLPSRAETLGYGVLECIGAEIPFIASRIPAYEEVVDPRDHASVLFEPHAEALARKLEETITRGVPTVRFRKNPKDTYRHWVDWHERVRTTPRPASRLAPKPTVTVCMAHRGRPEFLRQALASLENQTDRDFELILIDDGSTDEPSRAYLRELKKQFARRRGPRWRLVQNSVSQGVSAARNRIARLARTDYLLFMDDDNLAKPAEVARLKALARQTGADIVTCGFERFYEQDAAGLPQTTSYWFPVGDNLSVGPFLNDFGDMNSLIRRRVFLKVGGLRSFRGAVGEDSEFFMRALIAGYRLETTPERLFYYRDHAKGLSRKVDDLATSKFLIRPFQEQALQGRVPDYFELIQSWYGYLRAARGRDRRIKLHPLVPPGRSDLFRRSQGFDQPLYETECPHEIGRLVIKNRVKIEHKSDHLCILSLGTETELLFRKLKLQGSRRVIIQMDLFSTNHARVNPSVVGRRQVVNGPAQTLRMGRNCLIVLLSDLPKDGKIRLKTHGPAGTHYAIRKIEIHRES